MPRSSWVAAGGPHAEERWTRLTHNTMREALGRESWNKTKVGAYVCQHHSRREGPVSLTTMRTARLCSETRYSSMRPPFTPRSHHCSNSP